MREPHDLQPPRVEPHDFRLRRLTMRSWRRGMREMDLLLGPFADAELADMAPAALDAFEALLAENDPDLYRWVSGAAAPPAAHGPIIARIAAFHVFAAKPDGKAEP